MWQTEDIRLAASFASGRVSCASFGPTRLMHGDKRHSAPLLGMARAKTGTVSTALPASREYQTELLEESIRRNIIITLPTGTGKTHIAILRIKHQLETSDAKVCWFLCPTIALCTQQHAVISGVIPAVGLITGNLQPERWTSHDLWTGLVSSHRVIVSTPQCFLDALTHGYLHLHRDISLIIFDEAHHATADHPYNRIMQSFYWKTAPEGRPSVLGLTASPVIGAHVTEQLQTLETNLDSVVRLPLLRSSADQLRQFTFSPIIKYVSYPRSQSSVDHPSNLRNLWDVLASLNIEEDPYIISTRGRLSKLHVSSPDYHKLSQYLAKMIHKQSTFTHSNLKTLGRVTQEIYEDIGAWAVDRYLQSVIDGVLSNSLRPESSVGRLDADERSYFLRILERSRPRPDSMILFSASSALSPKVVALIDTLIKEKEASESLDMPFVGLLFVTRRDFVFILRDVIQNHPLTSSSFRCGCLVGLSNNTKRTSIFDLYRLQADLTHEQTETLNDFRLGTINLLIATSVAEEGIDIQACGSVIRFDLPPNIQSWVQSQGRARLQRSSFTLLVSEDLTSSFGDWESIKDEVEKQCRMERARMMTYTDEESDSEDGENLEFVVEATGARLTLAAAIGHLQYFCDHLPQSQYCLHRPKYTVEPEHHYHLLPRGAVELPPPSGPFRASVTLPILLPPHLRIFNGTVWHSKKMSAKRSVALQVNIELYKAGLLNDHLLPFDFPLEVNRDEINRMLSAVDKRDGLVSSRRQKNPWRVASDIPLTKYLIFVEGIWSACCYLPSPSIETVAGESLSLFDSDGVRRVVTLKCVTTTDDTFEEYKAQKLTRSFFWPRWGSRMKWGDCRYLYYCFVEGEDALNVDAEESMLKPPDIKLFSSGSVGSPIMLRCKDGTQCLFIRVLETLTEQDLETLQKRHSRLDISTVEVPIIEAQYIPRRSDFTISPPGRDHVQHREGKKVLLLLSEVLVYEHSPNALQASFMIPSLLHRISHRLLAEELRGALFDTTPLAAISRRLILNAITAPGAQAAYNYERLETLGDTVLKLVTSICVLKRHEYWHEGYLSKAKDHIVSNATLAMAALRADLGQYIIREPFRGRRWVPETAEADHENLEGGMLPLSSKMLADVVESLIGACYTEYKFNGAVMLLNRLLPRNDIAWETPQVCATAISKQLLFDGIRLPRQLKMVENMIGYEFKNKLRLLEALTHPSHQQSAEHGVVSYERMEFLGDALLDMVVTEYFYNMTSEDAKPGRLHLLKICAVNADLLGYLFFSIGIDTEVEHVISSEEGCRLETKKQRTSLFECFFHSSSLVLDSLQACSTRCNRSREGLHQSLFHGSTYPWASLKDLRLPKMFGDMVESLIGAIYIDSEGCNDACQRFLDRIGHSALIHHFSHEDVDLRHPVSVLGEWVSSQEAAYGSIVAKEGNMTRCTIVANQEVLSRAEVVGVDHAAKDAASFLAAECALENLGLR